MHVFVLICEVQETQEDQLIQFLMGLNEWYQSVKSLILLMKLLPTTNKVLSIILQEERQQNYGSNKSPDAKVEETNVLANAAESGGVDCNFKKGRE